MERIETLLLFNFFIGAFRGRFCRSVFGEPYREIDGEKEEEMTDGRSQ